MQRNADLSVAGEEARAVAVCGELTLIVHHYSVTKSPVFNDLSR
jgi:hypothetical protein